VARAEGERTKKKSGGFLFFETKGRLKTWGETGAGSLPLLNVKSGSSGMGNKGAEV